jgi:hypothetical protein
MIRLMTGSLVMGLLALPAASPAADDDPNEILAKAIKAHGGEEYLTKHPAGRAKNKGKLTIAGIGEVDFTQETAYMMPDKFKESMELNVAGQQISVVTLVNGDKFSVEANGKEVPVTDQIKEALAETKHLLKVARLTSLLKEKGIELASAGEVKIDDKPALGVRVSLKGQKDITLYFDKKTNLLMKVERRATDPNTGSEITEERIVAEYQKNDSGVPMPKKLIVKRDGKDYLTSEVVEGKMLEKIEDSEFSK